MGKVKDCILLNESHPEFEAFRAMRIRSGLPLSALSQMTGVTEKTLRHRETSGLKRIAITAMLKESLALGYTLIQAGKDIRYAFTLDEDKTFYSPETAVWRLARLRGITNYSNIEFAVGLEQGELSEMELSGKKYPAELFEKIVKALGFISKDGVITTGEGVTVIKIDEADSVVKIPQAVAFCTRRYLRKTVSDLARECGLTRKALLNIESEKVSTATTFTHIELAEYAKCSLALVKF